MRKALLLAITSLLLVACQQDVVYTHFDAVPAAQWSADSAMVFHPVVDDSINHYRMHINIRHTDRYAYQNLWLFVDVTQDSLLLRRDTIEAQMANDKGEWYGAGLSKFTLPMIYLDDVELTRGEYTITIHQGMREETLKGITEVGLKVVKQ